MIAARARSGVALLIAILAMVAALSLAAHLVASARAAVAESRIERAAIVADGLAVGLEPFLVDWATRWKGVRDDEQVLPAGWFEIERYEVEEAKIRVLAIDLYGCVSVHPEAQGRLGALPDSIRSALRTVEDPQDAILDSYVDTEALAEGVELFPRPWTEPRADSVVSSWITHIDTTGWNTLTAQPETLQRAGVSKAGERATTRWAAGGGPGLVNRSSAFAFIIEIYAHSVSDRRLLVLVEETDPSHERYGWSVVERRSL